MDPMCPMVDSSNPFLRHRASMDVFLWGCKWRPPWISRSNHHVQPPKSLCLQYFAVNPPKQKGTFIPRHPVIFSADDWGVPSPPKRIVFGFHAPILRRWARIPWAWQTLYCYSHRIHVWPEFTYIFPKKNQPFHGSVNIPVRSSHGIRHGIGCELGTSMAPQKVGCLHRTDHW